MKLKYAYLCVSCEEITDCAPHGICQVCGSEAVYPLSKAVTRDALILPTQSSLLSTQSLKQSDGGR